MPYEAGKTYTYTQLNRFTHLSNSTQTGTTLGTVNRVACDANELFTVFRIQTTDDAVLNKLKPISTLNSQEVGIGVLNVLLCNSRR